MFLIDSILSQLSLDSLSETVTRLLIGGRSDLQWLPSVVGEVVRQIPEVIEALDEPLDTATQMDVNVLKLNAAVETLYETVDGIVSAHGSSRSDTDVWTSLSYEHRRRILAGVVEVFYFAYIVGNRIRPRAREQVSAATALGRMSRIAQIGRNKLTNSIVH